MISPTTTKVILLSLLIALALTPVSAGNSRRLISSDPLARGLDLAARKYPDEAAVEFDKCTDLTRVTPHQLSLIAKAYYDAGNTSSALIIIAYAVSQERVKREIGEMAYLLDLRGTVLALLNRRDEAISSYKLAAATQPDLAYVYWHKVGRELVKCKKYKEALPFLKKGIKAGRMNGFVYTDIGHCYMLLDSPAEAIEPLTESINTFVEARKRDHDAYMPSLIQSYKYLIQAYEAIGDKKQASVWQKRLDALVGDFNLDLFGEH
ncbi:MAG: hypothetical protein P4L53_11300 [Candidatus Obscuribacterales bacterium]|nr:hypothetical protein [Candidatus Obscuribacterales bacterium]